MEKEKLIEKQAFYEIEKSVVKKKLTELSFHQASEQIYSNNEEFIDLLSENILENGLFNRIVINKKGQILSGNQRFLALKKIGAEELEVDQIKIDAENELEYIISSNQQRVKTFLDKRNEIQTLFNKYSPGQGTNAGGANTIKRISMITGYTEGEISKIRKIDKIRSEFLTGIDSGKTTLHGASRLCDSIVKLDVIGTALEKDCVSNIDIYQAEKIFIEEITEYCKTYSPEYYSMIVNNEMEPNTAYNQLFTDKVIITNPKEGKERTGKVEADCNCPLCRANVKHKEEKEFIEKFREKIEAKLNELKEVVC